MDLRLGVFKDKMVPGDTRDPLAIGSDYRSGEYHGYYSQEIIDRPFAGTDIRLLYYLYIGTCTEYE